MPVMNTKHQDWQPVRPLSGGRWMGLCPLHADRKPSFLVDPGKSLFYCYGCGRGGDVIRFPVDTAGMASAMLLHYRDEHSLGASDLHDRCGDVCANDGTLVARVSYNGRVWTPDGTWLRHDATTIDEEHDLSVLTQRCAGNHAVAPPGRGAWIETWRRANCLCAS